ncbi:MAG: hypothetical protein ACRD8O_14130 [Bryobacteraceae bacterium]
MSFRTLGLVLVAAALIPSAYTAWIARDMPHVGHFHDDGVYFVCAKSVAEGKGYRLLSFPGSPYETKYPPLYSMLLAAVWLLNDLFPANLGLATLAAWLAVPTLIAAARWWVKDFPVGEVEGWVVCAVLAVSPYVAFSGIFLMSDLLLCALILTVLAVAPRPGMAIAAGLLGGAAYLTRTTALPLLAAIPLWYLTKRRFRDAAMFAAAMLPAVAGWAVWSALHRPQVSDPSLFWYFDYAAFYRYDVSLADIPLIVQRNFETVLVKAAGPFAFHVGDTFLVVHSKRMFLLVAVAGLIRIARRHGMTPYHWFAVFLLPMTLVYHYPPGERYMMPFYPLLLAGLAAELRHLGGMLVKTLREKRDFGNRAVATLILLVVAGFACAATWVAYAGYQTAIPGFVEADRKQATSNQAVFRWMRENLPADSTILAYRDPVVYLHTGLKSMRRPGLPMPSYREDRERALSPFFNLVDFAEQRRLQYLLATSADWNMELPEEDSKSIRQALTKDKRLQAVYSSPDTVLYRLTTVTP